MSIIATRLELIKPSPTIAVTTKAKQLKDSGKDVIGLGAGEPDFDTPDNVKEAAILAIKQGDTKYTAVDGTPALKKAVQQKFLRENNISYQLDEITVGCGAKQVIFNAFMASINPGDEVIIPAPYWVSYPDMAMLFGAKPVFISAPIEQDFKITPQQLAKAITAKTKWLILNSPSNPTGSSYSKDEILAFAEVLRSHPQVYILSDDIYEHVIYDGFTFSTIAGLAPDLKERILTVNGTSKSYAMTGWRIGYAGGSKELIKAIGMLQSQSTSNACSISQAAAVEALNGRQDYIKDNSDLFKSRRDLVVSTLSKIPGIKVNNPQGAFYVFPSCLELIGKKNSKGEIIRDSLDFTNYLLDEALVAAVPGSAFGLEGYFRISYATATDLLVKACERIRNACEKLS